MDRDQHYKRISRFIS